MTPIFIFGAGGLGHEIRAMLSHLPQWALQGFYDDNLPIGKNREGVPCLGGRKELVGVTQPINLVLAIGDPATKCSIALTLEQNPHIHFPSLVHPKANLLDPSSIRLGDGSIVTAGCVLTTSIDIGRHVLVNLNATIGHNAHLGYGCSIMPGSNLAGGVRLGKGVLVGAGACILNGIQVSDYSRVGAGAVVTRSVAPNTTVIGVPARSVHKV